MLPYARCRFDHFLPKGGANDPMPPGRCKAGPAVFVSNFEKFKIKFVYFSVANQSGFIVIYMNVCCTMCSTLKEVRQCIEK